MHFAPDTSDTLEFVVALCNTSPGASRSGLDELSSPSALTALLVLHSYSGRFDRDDSELASVLATRDLLRSVWTSSRDAAVASVNKMLRDAAALPYLLKHDHFDWHLHATPVDAPLAERIRVEAAMALIDVIRSDEMGRMRVCAAPDCDGLLLDLSRNGSKQYCSVRCGNRVNQEAWRGRSG